MSSMNKRRISIVSLVIALLMVAVMLPAAVFALELNSGGYYEIASEDDLRWFADQVNGGNTDIDAVLTSNINVSGIWTPIGTEANSFGGTFDGNGYGIIGSLDSSEACAGVFGYNSGTIKNLYTNVSFSADYIASADATVYRGGICGYNSGTIEDCYTLDTIKGTIKTLAYHIDSYSGGLCGYNVGSIADCFSYGDCNVAISGSGSMYSTGGICGTNSGSMSNCYNNSFNGWNPIGNGFGTSVENRPASDFESGAIAYLLNGGSGGTTWYQNLGDYPDSTPSLDSASGTVYYVENAGASYAKYANKTFTESSLTVIDYIYDGANGKATVMIPDLTEGIDFEIIYADAVRTEIGIYGITIKGIGNCAGYVETDFEVNLEKDGEIYLVRNETELKGIISFATGSPVKARVAESFGISGAVILDNVSLEIPEDMTVTVNSGADLTIVSSVNGNGGIVNKGSLTNDVSGTVTDLTVTNDGTLINRGTLAGVINNGYMTNDGAAIHGDVTNNGSFYETDGSYASNVVGSEVSVSILGDSGIWLYADIADAVVDSGFDKKSVALLKDVSVGGDLEFASGLGKSIVLELGGFELSLGGKMWFSGCYFTINGSGTVSSSGSAAVSVVGSELTVSGATIEAPYGVAILLNGKSVTVENSTVSGGVAPFKAEGSGGSINIVSGEFSSGSEGTIACSGAIPTIAIGGGKSVYPDGLSITGSGAPAIKDALKVIVADKTYTCYNANDEALSADTSSIDGYVVVDKPLSDAVPNGANAYPTTSELTLEILKNGVKAPIEDNFIIYKDAAAAVTFSWKDGAGQPVTAPKTVGSYVLIVSIEEGDIYKAQEIEFDFEIVYASVLAEGALSDSEKVNGWCNTDTLTVTAPSGAYVSESLDGIVSESASFNVSSEMDGTLTYYICDTANGGVIAEKQIDVKWDKTAPSLAESVTNLTDAFADVTLDSDDALSGVDSFKLLCSDTSVTITDNGNGSYSVSGMLPGKTYELNASVTDAAGNTAAKTVTVIAETVKLEDEDGAAGSLLEISAVAGDFVYNGAEHKPSLTVKWRGAELKLDFDYTITYKNNVNAGTAKVVVTGKNGFAGTVEREFTIAPKSITVTVTVKDKIYDGSADAAIDTIVFNGKYAGDVLELLNVSATFNDKNVGADKSVTFSGCALGGADAGNYLLSAQPESVTADVTPKDVTFTFTAEDKQYDGTTAVNISGVMFNGGLCGSDDVSVTINGASFASSEVGTDINVTFAGFDISGADKDNYNISYDGVTVSADIYNTFVPSKDKEYTVNSNDGWLNTAFVVTAKNGYLLSLDNKADGEWKTELSVSGNASNGELDFYVKDIGSGAVSLMVTESYKIDTEAPLGSITLGSKIWSVFVTSPVSELWFKDAQSFTFAADDALSGADKTEYFVSETVLTEDEVKSVSGWTEGAGVTVDAADGKVFAVYLKITDKAGNVSYVSTDLVTYDTSAPKFDGVDPSASSIGPFYTTQEIKVSDADIESITLDGVAVTSPVIVAGNVEKIYVIVATDSSGNTAEIKVEMRPISDITDIYKDITLDNVKSSDSATLANVRDLLEAIDVTTATDDEKTLITKALDEIKALEDRVKTVAEAIDGIATGLAKYTLDNVTSDDRYVINNYRSTIADLLATDNLTDAERDALKGYDDICKALLAKIDEIAAEIDRVLDGVDGYDIDYVKEYDASDIRGWSSDIGDLLNTDNLTYKERNQLSLADSTCDALLERIEDVRDEINDIYYDVNGYSETTVKSSDKSDIEYLIDRIDTLLDGNNLIQSQIYELEELKDDCRALLDKIEEVAGEIKAVTEAANAFDEEKVKATDAEAIKAVRSDIEALLDTENLTPAEREALEALADRCDALLDKINGVEKEIADIASELDKYSEETVKSSDKEALDALEGRVEALLGSDNLTEAQRAEVEALGDKIDKLKNKIDEVAKAIEDVTEKVVGYDVSTVKVSNKTAITNLVTEIDALLATQNLTESEREALEALKEKCDALLDKIAETGDVIAALTDELAGYTKETVKSSDKAPIEEINSEIESLLKSENLTDELRTGLEALNKKADELLARIDEVQSELAAIAKALEGYDKETVKSSDKAAIEGIEKRIDALLATQNLTDAERKALQQPAAKCDELLARIEEIAKAIAEVTSGVNKYSENTVKSSDKADIESLSKKIDELLATKNLTDAERKALEALKTKCGALLAKIADVQKTIAELTDEAGKYSSENVKTSDQAALEALVKKIDAILATDNLTDAERKAVQGLKDKCDALLKLIADAKAAIDTENTEKAKDITEEDVSIADKNVLDGAKKDYEDGLTDSGSVYTEDEKKAIEDELARIEQLLDLISRVNEVIGMIEALPSPDTISPDDEAIAETIGNIWEKYNALTEGEKTMVGDDNKAKLDAATARLTAYEIIEGNGGIYKKKTDISLDFKANGPYSKFTGVKIDGVLIASSYYTAKDGSTIVSISPEYLDSIEVGAHNLTVTYTDGEACCEFHVEKADVAFLPITLSIIGILVLLLIILILIIKKRQNEVDPY